MIYWKLLSGLGVEAKLLKLAILWEGFPPRYGQVKVLWKYIMYCIELPQRNVTSYVRRIA